MSISIQERKQPIPCEFKRAVTPKLFRLRRRRSEQLKKLKRESNGKKSRKKKPLGRTWKNSEHDKRPKLRLTLPHSRRPKVIKNYF
jgi:hypothetical protein